MSAETREAVEAALSAHFASEEDGAHLTEFIISMAGMACEEKAASEAYGYMVSRSPIHSLLGLHGMQSDHINELLALRTCSEEDD